MILDNAKKKINYFNKIGIHYEAVYHYIIRRRKETKGIFSNGFLNDITAGLISFDMQRMMGNKQYLSEGEDAWASQLRDILKIYRRHLSRLENFQLQDIDLSKPDLKGAIISIFNHLAKSGTKGLNKRSFHENFPVGASKILHFLIPDLFIIVDSNARRALSKFHESLGQKVGGDSYIKAMRYYQVELTRWSLHHRDPFFKKLIEADKSWKSFRGLRTTPIPRIIDKCTFVGNV